MDNGSSVRRTESNRRLFMDSMSSNDENQLAENTTASSTLKKDEEDSLIDLIELAEHNLPDTREILMKLYDLRKKIRLNIPFPPECITEHAVELIEMTIEHGSKLEKLVDAVEDMECGSIKFYSRAKENANASKSWSKMVGNWVTSTKVPKVKTTDRKSGELSRDGGNSTISTVVPKEDRNDSEININKLEQQVKALTDELRRKQGIIDELQQNINEELGKRQNYDKKEIYSLDPKKMGKCIILNHTRYEIEDLSNRHGTEDVDALKKIFRTYNFDVKEYQNRRVNEIKEILKKAGNEDHTAASCFVLCVLTHGSLNKKNEEILCAYDSTYPTENLFSPFLGCKTLAGKPKLFFIQACRGPKFDKGIGIPTELVDLADNYNRKPLICCSIPLHADFFIAYSTVRGYVSFRNQSKGSWFIQALCKTLEERTGNLDLASILTIVCYKLSYNHQSENYDNSKQVPTILTTLTKRLVFPSNNQEVQNMSVEENKNCVFS